MGEPRKRTSTRRNSRSEQTPHSVAGKRLPPSKKRSRRRWSGKPQAARIVIVTAERKEKDVIDIPPISLAGEVQVGEPLKNIPIYQYTHSTAPNGGESPVRGNGRLGPGTAKARREKEWRKKAAKAVQEAAGVEREAEERRKAKERDLERN
ncbi:MAG: hypothetical protein M1813_002181 [Trichoglossum hirsutum]|nr:MAG: hypothetical protein M1813_002181 [Trichoglossum hirsutum]